MKKSVLAALSLVGILGLAAPVISTDAAWKADSQGRWYATKSTAKGYYVGWKKIGKYTYYFDNDGYAATSWRYLKSNNGKYWYFFDPMGRMITNRWVDGYYLTEDGSMAVNTSIDGILVDENGNRITSETSETEESTDPSQETSQEQELVSCWVSQGEDWYYYNYKGEMATGWLTIKDKTYYLDPETGIRQYGVVQVDKKYYYLDPETGEKQTGWVTTPKGKTYYFSPKADGAALTKWQKIKKKYYYFNKKGVLARNKWVGKYYVNEEGQRAYGWVQIGSKKYYLNPKTGRRCKGWQEISGKWYYFAKNGSMTTNKWVNKCYLKSNGVMATKCWVGKYYVNAKGKRTKKTRPTGFFISKGKTYYLNKGYEKVINNWVEVDGKHYYFNNKGVMVKNAWVNDFYVGSDGVRYVNKFLTLTNSDGSKSTYFFPSSGIKATGLISYNGKTYYFNSVGVMQTGWQNVSGATYYFNPNGGAMIVNDTVEINGVYYSFDATGHMQDLDAENSDLALGKAIADYACKFIGNPYSYGGTSLTNGADCSGFTMKVMEHFGISIPRVAADQATGTSAWATTTYAPAKVISVNNLQPGDLIFYYSPISHVGIYIGNGQIVHASNSSPYPIGGIKVSAYDYTTITKCVRYW